MKILGIDPGMAIVGYAILDLLQTREIKKVIKDGVEFIK